MGNQKVVVIIKKISNGTYIEYDNKGKVIKKEQYKNNELTGEYIGEDKQAYSGFIVVNYLDGELNGAYTRFYEDGKKRVETKYLKDKLEGEYKEYYENGKPKLISNYKDDQLNGKYLSYYEDGKLESSCYYKENELNGECIKYYTNGKVKEKSLFKNGNFDGELIEYYENGNMKVKKKSINGKLNGECSYFYENVNKEISLEEKVEFIDIGGPSMLRSAAKNFASVTVVTSEYRDWETITISIDRKSTRLNSSHITRSRMPSSA